MFKFFQCYDYRAQEFIGVPLVFSSEAEASLWFNRQKFCADIQLKCLAKVSEGVVLSIEPYEVPVNAYEIDEVDNE